ncbi:helix-turn-helix domain-containing protein [Streptomyces sp. NPDC058045]|uniref:helix-turn-helix domain-containing protein n=1 Tax=Streptomyces sp. NPDC058045 TaxID=3346311 RepID=UPI0036E7C1BB
MPHRPPPPGPGHTPGEIGRRVAARRTELGLSREDVAVRAGSAPGYLQYLEEQPARPGTGFLVRLAEALETSVAALTGTEDPPPLPGRPASRARLVELSPEECRALLAAHGVGRIAVTGPTGPAVEPVAYAVLGEEIAFRAAPDAVPDEVIGTEIALEADHLDEALSQGWSVLAVGRARRLTDPATVRRLDADTGRGPWAGAGPGAWTVLAPERITGRGIRIPDTPHRPRDGGPATR